MEEKTYSRSVIIKKFGGYDSLLVQSFKLSELDGNVEVKVDYGGLNFADLCARQGVADKQLPFVMGVECTGTITAIGTKDTKLKIGQKVICFDDTDGVYRDVIRVKPNKCYLLPDFMDSKIGAAVFLNYLTAYFSVIELGNLRKNEKILIISCAGGVGCAATQLAKTVENVQIFGTGSSHKEYDAKKNGVDTFYSHDVFLKEAKEDKYDLIITNQHGDMFNFLENLLNPFGRIVMIGTNNVIQNEQKLSTFSLFKSWWSMKEIPPETLIKNNRVIAGLHLATLIENNPEKIRTALDYIFDLYRGGKINPIVHSTWPMSKIIEATKMLGQRKNIGKVLIYMKEHEN